MTYNIYDYIDLITGAFGTYIIYKFMSIFFDRSQVNKKRELFSYLIYFIIINIVYLTVNIPILTLLSNLILFMLLTLNYQASMKNRIIFTIFIYLTLMIIESMVVLVLLYVFKFPFSMGDRYTSIIGMITVKIISYIFVLLVESYNGIKKNVNMPTLYWLLIFLIPSGSLYLIIVLLEKYNSNTYSILVSILILFTINIVTFYLYEVLSNYLKIGWIV